MPDETQSGSVIDWTQMLKPAQSESITLSDAELNTDHDVVFVNLTEIPPAENGGGNRLVAEVTSETLEGDSLWLIGLYGPQNGLHSLVKAAGDPDNIIGRTFTFTRVESENSPAGYAYRWRLDGRKNRQ